jgi:hypothetical protein
MLVINICSNFIHCLQSLTAEEEQLKMDNEAMAKLSGLADLVLSRFPCKFQ